jgi:hypothetical protein
MLYSLVLIEPVWARASPREAVAAATPGERMC